MSSAFDKAWNVLKASLRHWPNMGEGSYQSLDYKPKMHLSQRRDVPQYPPYKDDGPELGRSIFDGGRYFANEDDWKKYLASTTTHLGEPHHEDPDYDEKYNKWWEDEGKHLY